MRSHTYTRSPYGWSVSDTARPNWREFLSKADQERVNKIDRETNLRKDARRDALRAKAWPRRLAAIKKETAHGDR